MWFYAVAVGRQIGIYTTWPSCEEQVKGFKGAKHKKFPTHSEAEAYLNEHALPPNNNDDSINDENLATSSGNTSNNISQHEPTIYEPVGLKNIESKAFREDSEGYVIVNTGSACRSNVQKKASTGYGVFFGDNHVLNVSKPVEGVTNNLLELQAAIEAIKIAKKWGITKLCLCTNNKYVIDSATSWMKGWKAKNWRRSNGEPVKNVEEFRELDNLLEDKSIQIKWNYVHL